MNETTKNEELLSSIFQNLKQIRDNKSSFNQDGHEDSKNALASSSPQLSYPSRAHIILQPHCYFPFQDPVSYRRRVKSFYPPSVYFAKPISLSPLVCARFGWRCVSKDVIQCAECRHTIAIIFHPDLSPEAHKELSLTYRNMLATRHDKTCPFALDAIRWLVMDPCQQNLGKGDDKDSNNNNATKLSYQVPPYLIPMSKGFEILEDFTESGFLTRDFLREAALGMAMKCYDSNIDKLYITVPGDLLKQVKVVCGLYPCSDDVTFSFLQSLLFATTEISPTDQDDDKWYKVMNNHQDDGEKKQQPHIVQRLSIEIILLVLFGWSVTNLKNVNDNGKEEAETTKLASKKKCFMQAAQDALPTRDLFVVSCPMCLCECTIPCSLVLSNICHDDGKKTSKRRRLEEGENVVLHGRKETNEEGDNSGKESIGITASATHETVCNKNTENNSNSNTIHPPPMFHLLDSHRHFCPMCSGFSKDEQVTKDILLFDRSTVTTTRAGWEIYLSSLCRGNQDTIKNLCHQEGIGITYNSSTNIQASATSKVQMKIHEKIRKALRGSLLYHSRDTNQETNQKQIHEIGPHWLCT